MNRYCSVLFSVLFSIRFSFSFSFSESGKRKYALSGAFFYRVRNYKTSVLFATKRVKTRFSLDIILYIII